MTIVERLEAASEGSRELDFAIADVILGPVKPPYIRGHCEKYTTSLDAAMTLVPEGANTYLASEDRHSHSWEWSLRDKLANRHHARAATAPLALCIAALKARGL